MGSIPTEVKIFFLYLVWFPDSLYQGQPPSGLFMGLISTLIYTAELILCSTICVHSATRHNIHIKQMPGYNSKFYFYTIQRTTIFRSEYNWSTSINLVLRALNVYGKQTITFSTDLVLYHGGRLRPKTGASAVQAHSLSSSKG